MQEIRIGKISSINYAAGKARVTYDDKDGAVTPELPFITSGTYNMPEIGDVVAVAHLSNGASSGVILGKVFNASNAPGKSGKGVYYTDMGDGASVYAKGGSMEVAGKEVKLKDDTGSFSISDFKDLKQAVSDLSNRVSDVESKV